MTSGPRVGILGGTFDPVHHGHLDAADAAQRALDLAEVALVPSRIPPHKTTPRPASGYHRFAMAALATADRPRLRVSALELEATGTSYTSRTLERLCQAGYDRSQLFFIVGSDAFADIAHWHDYPTLVDRSHFVVVARPGCPLRDLAAQLPDLADRMRRPDAAADHPASGRTVIWLVEAATRDVSSTEIRRRRTTGEPVDDLVPPAVATYIARHQLYASSAVTDGAPLA